MYLTSPLHLVVALTWTLCMFAAFVGWGSLLLRLCRARQCPLAIAAVAGLGLLVLAGGLLNLAAAVTVLSSRVLIGVGAGLALAELVQRRDDAAASVRAILADRRGAAVFALTLLLLGVLLVASSHQFKYASLDDRTFYLAAPVKMMAHHQFGADPFSERRVISSVGANYYLQAVLLSVLQLNSIQMTDHGLGVLLVALVGFALGGELKLSLVQRSLLAFFLLACPQLHVNLTFVDLPSGCYLALPLLLCARALETRPVLRAVLIGSTIAVVSAMKGTYVVGGVLFLLLSLVFVWRRAGLSGAWRHFVVASVAGVAVILPWAITNLRFAGTLFFPLLGRGFHYSAYHQFGSAMVSHPLAPILKVAEFCVPFAVIAVMGTLLAPAGEAPDAVRCFMWSAVLATFIVGCGTGSDSVRRYNYPILLPGMIVVFGVLCARAKAARAAGRREAMAVLAPQWLGAATASGLALYVGMNGWTHEYRFTADELVQALHSQPAELLYPGMAEQYAALNAALPRDGAILETVGNAFLLDFSHHHIFMADWPAAASPKPGWPVHGSGDDLARFLGNHGIRYLAFSYSDDGAIHRVWAQEISADPSRTQWLRDETTAAIVAFHQYDELAVTRKHIFDDGQIYVLDLDTPAAPHSQHAPERTTAAR